MASKIINNKCVQWNLVLEKQIECGGLKLLKKRLKLVLCKPSQCNVHVSTKNLAGSHRDLTLSTDILPAIFQKNSYNSN